MINVLPSGIIPVKMDKAEFDTKVDDYISFQKSIGCIAEKSWAEEFVRGDYILAEILKLEALKVAKANSVALKKNKQNNRYTRDRRY